MWNYFSTLLEDNSGKLIITLLTTFIIQLAVKFYKKFLDIQYKFSLEVLAPMVLIALFDILVIAINVAVWFALKETFTIYYQVFIRSIALFSPIINFIIDMVMIIILSNKFYVLIDQNDVRFLIKKHKNYFKDTVQVAPKNSFDGNTSNFRVLNNKRYKDAYYMEKAEYLIDREKQVSVYKVSRRNLFRAWFSINKYWSVCNKQIPYILWVLFILSYVLYISPLYWGDRVLGNDYLLIVTYVSVISLISALTRMKIFNNILNENNRYKSRFIREKLWQ
ncbi:hypothetical protein [Staphylococcus simulans]|uniref:hypothetical protein n=1 Tax=Staphylococcus simulans TaxID=1286 RepID=UPI000D1F848F|nr:hypothetical protein [Staphylococcus simulans]PTJ95584.1 hypothetical protein BU013_10640 [Staphylococcus simulans]